MGGEPAIGLDRNGPRTLLGGIRSGTPQGRGTISVEARRDSAQVRVEVRDDGPGLPPGLAFRGRTTKVGGSGLGLLVSRAVVVAHGGTLELVPVERGACFRLLLPVG